jgi:hypothetical protein
MRRHLTALFIVFLLVLAACSQVEPEPGAAPEPTATVETPATGTPEAGTDASAPVEAAREALAARTGVDVDEIELVTSEPMEWPNACLGLPQSGEMCAEVITPGWLVVLSVPGDDVLHEARTSQNGDVVRFQEMVDPSSELPLAAARAREQLALELGIAGSDIEVLSFSEEEWTDSCLGLGGPAESCLQAITPGWLVMLSAPDADVVYEARTDETGEVVRFQEATDPAAELPAAALRAREQLAADLGIALDEVEVVSFSQEEWTDSCLGMGGAAEMCLQVITPGWRVVLNAQEQSYEAHTDRTGDSVRIGSAAPLGSAGRDEPRQPAITFQRTGGFTGEDVTYNITTSGTLEKLTGPAGPDQAIEALPVDPLAVTELLAELEAAGFMDLALDATVEAPCCDRYIYYLTVTAGELTNSIAVVEGEENVPEAAQRSVELVQAFIEKFDVIPTR